MVLISIVLSFMIFSPLVAMSEESSEDFYDEEAGIVSVPVDRFSGYAAELSDALYEGLESQNNRDMIDPEEWQRLEVYYDSEEEVDVEIEYEKERLFKEHREIFMASEQDIYQSTLSYLRDRGYRVYLKKYRDLVTKEKKWPSRAVLIIAKSMLENPIYEYEASELLEYMRKKVCPNWTDSYGYEHMEVESEICRTLSPYFLDKFNTLVETTHPQEPTAPLYTALRKCAGYLGGDPDGSWDDIECTYSYIYEFSRRHLRKYALWYLEEKAVPLHLRDITLQMQQRARMLFDTTTYGWMPNLYDLLHLLQRWEFKGFIGTTSSGGKQHIWIKYPYQVRITEAGKVTVALIEEDPFEHEQLHGSIQISTITSRKNSGEILKMSTDGQDVALVPAFFKGERFKAMWSEKGPAKQKSLMGRAHHRVDCSYMNFDKVGRLVLAAGKKKS